MIASGMPVCAFLCALIAAAGQSAAAAESFPGPSFEADLTATSTNVTYVNYEGRTSPVFGTDGGRSFVSFAYRPRGAKPDTMWGVVTKSFAVTAGDSYLVVLEMGGDLPMARSRPGAVVDWIDKDGACLMTQDAKGKNVPLQDRLTSPRRTFNRGRALSCSRGTVPSGAVWARISYKIDLPDMVTGERVDFRRIAYYEHPGEEPFDVGDVEPPVLEMLTRSPAEDLSTPLRFRIRDDSGVNWAETTVCIDGKETQLSDLSRQGDALVYAPVQPWQRDSVHRVEISAVDLRGNAGYDCAFVAFTAQKPAHPAGSVRDDGMLLMDGKPFFPLGWFRVRPCEGNDYDLDKGIAEMKANGMNIAHAYLVGGLGSKREQELYDEFCAACNRHGVAIFVEPADRKPRGADFVRLTRANVLRGLSCSVPMFWGIGDDTSVHLSPDDVKYSHRLCKAIDPTAFTVSTDVATGPSGFTPYVPHVDLLFLESYPIKNPVPSDEEMAKAAQNLDNAWAALRAANVPGHSVVIVPQAFMGWNFWKRLPTLEEIRCQSYLAIAGRARGLVYYASCGNRLHVNSSDRPEKLENVAPLNSPEFKSEFFALTREIAARMPSLVLRDAVCQPTVRITSGPALNVHGMESVRCLLKEDGLLVAANSAHLQVTAEIVFADGRRIVHAFPRNGVLVTRMTNVSAPK